MAVESPADIFFIGHNRLSIEAGLYARFLGYRVTILGAGLSRFIAHDDAETWQLECCTTPLGLKAIESHSKTVEQSDIVDSNSLFQNYVIPIENTDLLAESIVDDCDSISVTIGESPLPEKVEEDVEYDTRIFELSVSFKDESKKVFEADVLIDFRDPTEMADLAVETEFTAEPITSSSPESNGSNQLLTSVDDFYLLSCPSTQPDAGRSYTSGKIQVVDLFKILSDRPTLDLYQ